LKVRSKIRAPNFRKSRQRRTCRRSINKREWSKDIRIPSACTPDVSMRCDKLIQIRAPESLAKALTSAADKRFTSRADYIRGALLDRLRADGNELAQPDTVHEE
jgi:hypothetical protein